MFIRIAICAALFLPLTAYYTPLSATAAEQEYRSSYAAALQQINYDDVKADLKKLFVDSKSWWPADYGHYGPFFIRLAWHCSGSYRTSDGRGGCSGGRQRFDPEQSWPDNTNLDKARKLLAPLKRQYGLGLSWGDLFILAGTTAVEDMGGPVLGFCGGRVDQPDGSHSIELGPSPEQEAIDPCQSTGQQGNCTLPLGSTTVGLIYLNPEGPLGQPLPDQSRHQIRDTFGRMSMNDTETIALIGGGHSFGKTHGACPTSPGPAPDVNPLNPWAGNCGSGVGVDAFTSGFEGPWTTTPTRFSNQYFQNLKNYTWQVALGPGGHNQWHITESNPPVGPMANGTGTQELMMLTSDVSLTYDPDYKQIVEKWAEDKDDFSNQFKHAWYKLVTRDMGPISRCVGNNIPPPQPFQYPLPSPPSTLADEGLVRDAIKTAMTTTHPSITPDIAKDGSTTYGAMFVKLAWHCANTFRITDHQGGCNGARIRYSPQSNWTTNANLDKVLEVLEPIKAKFGSSLSHADLIVLAGQTALEAAGAPSTAFCPGRTDATDGSGSENLEPREWSYETTLQGLRYRQKLLDLTDHEMVVLHGMMRSEVLLNHSGTIAWTGDPTVLSNAYFTTLVSHSWQQYTNPSTTEKQYKAKDADIYMLPTDVAFLQDASYMTIVQDFASDNTFFLAQFVTAWNKMMVADRFDGPVGNLCVGTPGSAGTSTPVYEIVLISVISTLLGVGCLVYMFRYIKQKQESDGYNAM